MSTFTISQKLSRLYSNTILKSGPVMDRNGTQVTEIGPINKYISINEMLSINY